VKPLRSGNPDGPGACGAVEAEVAAGGAAGDEPTAGCIKTRTTTTTTKVTTVTTARVIITRRQVTVLSYTTVLSER
jgi:hypothetical protein